MSAEIIRRGHAAQVRRVDLAEIAAGNLGSSEAEIEPGRAPGPAAPGRPAGIGQTGIDRTGVDETRVDQTRIDPTGVDKTEVDQVGIDRSVDESGIGQGRQQAYLAGYEAGRREAQAQVEAQRAELQALIAGINELMHDFEQRLASEVLSVSLELAKLIMRQTLRVKPDVVLAVVREAVASLPGLAEQSLLVVNPADAALLRELTERETGAGPLPWHLVEDPQIERGGCKLETPTTEVDATLETRWRKVIASLGRDDPWIEITV